MLHSSLSRLVAAAAVASVSAVSLFALASPVGAAKPSGITCTGLSGTFVATATVRAGITFSGCTGNTGGASNLIYLPTNGAVTWANGKTTTLGEPKLKELKLKLGAKGACAKGGVRLKSIGKVTADTTGSVSIPGVFSEDICVNRTTGAVTIAPGSKVKIS